MRLSIFDADTWREIGATLARNKTRTFMTAFGIFWGTAILAICWGGGRGLQGMLSRNFHGFATNLGFMSPSYTTEAYGGFNEGRNWTFRATDIAEIRRSIPEIEYSSTLQQTPTTAKQGINSAATSVAGIEPDYWRVQSVLLDEGRLLNESDEQFSRKSAVIGRNIARQLFGTGEAIGKFIQVDGLFFMVVGIARQKSEATIMNRVDDTVFIPNSTFVRAYNLGDNYGGFIYTTTPPATPTDIMPRIRRILYRNHAISPTDEGALQFGDVSEMFGMISKMFTGVDLLMLFVGLGTLLAGVIGVGNIMWIIVKERTSEIVIRRAIGATPTDIIMQILAESTVLTTVAGLAGITFAAIILGVLDTVTYEDTFGAAGFELSFATAVTIMIAFLVLGTAAGIIPALKSVRDKRITT